MQPFPFSDKLADKPADTIRARIEEQGDDDVTSGREITRERLLDLRNQFEEDREPVERELENRDLTGAEVLLIAQVLVGGDEHLEARGFRYEQELAIAKRVPPFLEARSNLEADEVSAQRLRNAVVEEDVFHAGTARTSSVPAPTPRWPARVSRPRRPPKS